VLHKDTYEQSVELFGEAKELYTKLAAAETNKQCVVHLFQIEGYKLLAVDGSSSDPFVAFRQYNGYPTTKDENHNVYKTSNVKNNLNPVWDFKKDSSFKCNLVTALRVLVYDYNLIERDVFMGSCGFSPLYIYSLCKVHALHSVRIVLRLSNVEPTVEEQYKFHDNYEDRGYLTITLSVSI